MKNILNKSFIILLSSMVFFSCNEDDLTGDSIKTPASPSLSVTLDFNNQETLVESETSYGFTVSLSEAQITDVVVNLEQISGTATDGVDYSMPHQITIPAGSTSASGSIDIHADELIEDTERAVIKIATGFEANVSGISSQTVTFNIQNVTSDDLVAHMEWAASEIATDNSGNEIDATDLADMRLLLTDIPFTAIIAEADGSSFETLTVSGADVADGEYYIVADFYAADENIIRDISLTTTFDQTGTINGLTYEHPAAINTGGVCGNNYYVIAKVTKSGGSYVIENVGENGANPFAAIIAGTYDVVSNGESTDPGPVNNPIVDWASTVTITDNGDGTFGLSDGWAGVYIDWYSIYGNTEPEPQTISDINLCTGGYTLAWTGPFGGSQELTGTVNGDGTITVRIDNSWGDFVDQVYTKQ